MSREGPFVATGSSGSMPNRFRGGERTNLACDVTSNATFSINAIAQDFGICTSDPSAGGVHRGRERVRAGSSFPCELEAKSHDVPRDVALYAIQLEPGRSRLRRRSNLGQVAQHPSAEGPCVACGREHECRSPLHRSRSNRTRRSTREVEHSLKWTAHRPSARKTRFGRTMALEWRDSCRGNWPALSAETRIVRED